jgi:putative transposase
MPKSTRIEYPSAFYHIINRGRNRENIFHRKSDFELFLEIIQKAHFKFGAIIHAYCLMDNHYHLLLETPNGNLSQIMHHIGSSYVQKYNRLTGCDGSLFKSRYKAILVDKDSYLLELNRYIHRNPIGLVKKLEDYKWSSYPSYIGLTNAPAWLNKEQTLEILALKNDLARYMDFVKKNRRQEREIYGNRKVLPSILGGDDFKREVFKK